MVGTVMVVVGVTVLGIVGGSTTSTTRPATRANAADTPVASSAEVTEPRAERLAMSVVGSGQADGLDVHTLYRGDGLVQSGRAAIVLAVRQAARAPCVRRSA